MTNKLSGLGTAMITPFQADGRVDFEALARLVELQIEGGTDYLVVLGTTGEAVTLSEREKHEVVDFVVNTVDSRLPLVLGLGGNNTAAVVETVNQWSETLSRHFAAILSVCPYYNKPSQEGLYRHFCALAEASPVPVILYNVPGRTGVNLLPETVVRLHKACGSRIAGIKEASGNIEQIKHLIDLMRSYPDFLVISGDDGIAAQLMDAGAAGLISVAANAFPREFGRIVNDHNHDLQQRFSPMVSLLFKEGNPAGIKTVLSFQGLINNVLRLPLVTNSVQVQEEIKQELSALKSCL